MNETVQHLIDEMAATQTGLVVIGAIVLVLGIVWLLLQFGILKPRNGNSIHSVTRELRMMNAEIHLMSQAMGNLNSNLPLHMSNIHRELEKLNEEQEKTKEGVQKLVNLEDYRGRG